MNTIHVNYHDDSVTVSSVNFLLLCMSVYGMHYAEIQVGTSLI